MVLDAWNSMLLLDELGERLAQRRLDDLAVRTHLDERERAANALERESIVALGSVRSASYIPIGRLAAQRHLG